MTSLTVNDVTSLATATLELSEQPPTTCENVVVCEAYNASTSCRQSRTAGVNHVARSLPVSPATAVTLPALSLAAEPSQLSAAVSRLLVCSPIRRASDSPAAAPVDAVRRRQRRPVDRSASEPLSSSSTLDGGALCRYKTELCRAYEEHGVCKYRDKCQFAHGRAELRAVARHPKYKTDLCKTYHTTGLCPYGPRCHFIHNDDERQLNEINRVVIERQRAHQLLQQKRLLMQAALTLVRRRQLTDAVAATVPRAPGTVSRSPSPQSLTLAADDPTTASWSTGSAAVALAELGRRVGQAAPHLTDAQVQAVVGRLLAGVVVLSDCNVDVDHHHQQLPQHVQLQHQQTRHQQTTFTQSSLNV